MPDYIIGIDLGTTNSALAYTPAVESESSSVDLFSIPQLVNAGEVASLDLLPSSLYIPGPNEFVEGALALPWSARPEYIVGPSCADAGRRERNSLSEFRKVLAFTSECRPYTAAASTRCA